MKAEDDGKAFLSIFPVLSDEEKLETLRRFTAMPVPVAETTILLLQLAQQSSEDELIRMEALKVIGLYTDGNQQSTVAQGICELLVTPDEDDDVQIAALQTLAWMPCSEAELGLALKLIHSDAYILVKEAAFALLCSHKHLPFAQHALKQLLQHEEFGVSAKRELSR